MYRQHIANSKKCSVAEVSLVELNFLLILDIPHDNLLKCQINQGHFYKIAFLELQIQTALCIVLL